MAHEPNISGAESKVAKIMAGDGDSPSRVKVYNDKLYDALMGGVVENPYGFSTDREEKSPSSSHSGVLQGNYPLPHVQRPSRSAERMRNVEKEGQRLKRLERHRQDVERLHQENDRKMKEKLSEAEKKREQRFQELTRDVEEGRRLADEVDKMLDLHELNRRNKVKKMFEEWNEGVYGNLQQEISGQLNSIDYKDIQRKKREAFEEYLAASNKKGAVFRDIIIESEYDPLQLNRSCIKVKGGGRLHDPTTRALDKHHEERGLLAHETQGGASTKRAQTRHTLETKAWATGKIEATSHGFLHKMMWRNPTEFDGKEGESSIRFDDWNIPKGRQVTNAEFHKGKRNVTPLHPRVNIKSLS